MKKQIKRFTLVEILMVTGMICLIAALIVVAYNGVYRSWSSKNTVATMKAAHLALDRYMLENGSFPKKWIDNKKGKLEFTYKDKSESGYEPSERKLAKDILQECAPYSYEKNKTVTVFDDFGPKTPHDDVQVIYYVFPHSNNKTFALMSKGKNGKWGDDDDIIYLPKGDKDKNLKPGFYMCTTDEDGKLPSNTDDIEPMAQ